MTRPDDHSQAIRSHPRDPAAPLGQPGGDLDQRVGDDPLVAVLWPIVVRLIGDRRQWRVIDLLPDSVAPPLSSMVMVTVRVPACE